MKVIIADDHPLTLIGLKHVVEELGHTVVAEAVDGDSLAAQATKRAFDLVISDYKMPGKHVLDVAKEIKKNNVHAKVLIVTAADSVGSMVRIVESSHVDGLIQKVADKKEFALAFKSIAKNERYIHQSVQTKVDRAVHSLTRRELDVVRLLVQGHNNQLVSERLSIARKTVDSHRTSIMKKLGVHNIVQLTEAAKEKGIVEEA